MRAGAPATERLAVGPPFLDESSLKQRVRELGAQISRDYQGCDLVVAGVLTGSLLFCCDLVRSIDLPLRLDFISITRYGGGSERVQIVKDFEEVIDGKDLLLVEDVVDSGLTLYSLLQTIAARRPASLAVCTLLDRPALRLVDLPLRYVGFEIQADYVVGYGLDWHNRLRHLPYLAALPGIGG